MNYKSTYKHDFFADIIVYSVAGDMPLVKLDACVGKCDTSDVRDAAARVADVAFSAGVDAFHDKIHAGMAATDCVNEWLCDFGYHCFHTESYV